FAMDANAIAKLANREEVNTNYAVKLRGLTINGEEWDVNNTYVLGCGSSNETSATIGITVDEGVLVQDLNGVALAGNELVMTGINDPGNYEAKFRLVNEEDPAVFVDYTVKMTKYIAFDAIVEQRWGNVLAVNNNLANNGGYDFSSFVWYKDGVVVSNKQYYSAGQNGAKLDTDAAFYVLVTTSDGEVLRTCESTVELTAESVSVYPTQVSRGQSLNVELQSYNEPVECTVVSVYNLKGVLIASKNVQGNITTIAAPSTSGTYIVKVSSGECTEQVKILVK
ncbi:MAG: T9SS type A sorting domain-containing protein, partial [Mangrovibacterium sp.]